MRNSIRITAALGLAVLAPLAAAQGYPAKPVRVIVGYPPGSTADIFARLVGQPAMEALGQAAVIDNITGAGGSIAATRAARAAPDGYTLMFMGLSLVYGPALYKNGAYDPVKDFAPVAQAINVPNVLVVHPGLPVKSVAELIALARGKPGGIDYASGGTGSSSQLATELLNARAGIRLREIAYKSTAQAFADTTAGQVSVYFSGLSSTLPLIRGGKLRALAVSGLARSAIAPDIPTVAETVPGFDANAWYGFTAPAGTPAEAIRRLNGEIVATIRRRDVGERILANGAEAVGSTPEQFGEAIRVAVERWGRLIESLGIKPE